jgi:hypothetical protein
MKKIKIVIVSFLMLGIGFLITSCEPEIHSLGSLPDESILDYEIVQDFVAKPAGNLVKLKSLTPGIIPYWSYTDSNGNELGHTNLGETSINLPFAGTYNISYTAFDKGGSVTSTETITVTENDESFFSDPRWNMLTNGVEGKTWIVNIVTQASIGFAAPEYINTTVGGGWGAWMPDSNNDIGWSGIETKDWGEITFDLNGGYNVTVTQTSEVSGSTQKTTTTGTYTYEMTDEFTKDRLIFNGGLKMLHTNAYYTDLSPGFSFSNVRLVELTESTLKYAMVRPDNSQTIVNLVPKN